MSPWRLDSLPFSAERRFTSALQKGFRIELPKNLDQQGDDTGPTRLVAGPDAGAIVAMKVFVEQKIIPPMGIVLEFSGAAKHGPAAARVAKENSGQAIGNLVRNLEQIHLAPRTPAALVVAIFATILVGVLGGEAAGVSVVGKLPSGLPHLALPHLDPAILWELAPGALAIVLVGYAEALGGAKAAAMQGGGDIDPNQELIAHGPANILSGLFGGFLVVGSLSKTSVAIAAGARSQLTNLVAAIFCFLTLVFLTPLFRGMPHPALAAIVIAAMLHLSKPGYLCDLLARSRSEFSLAAIVIAGELTLGVLQGIALGVALSLLMLIYRTSHPQGAVLGQLPGEEAYRDVRRHPEAITFPGLLIWRIGGELFFASIGHLDAGLKAAVVASRPAAKHVLLDADSVDFIDTSACDALLNSIKELQSQGITFAFVRVRDEVRERLRLGGVEAVVGSANFYERVTDGVRAWQHQDGLDALSAGRC